jgi:hypothetical protein
MGAPVLLRLVRTCDDSASRPAAAAEEAAGEQQHKALALQQTADCGMLWVRAGGWGAVLPCLD